jgi:threonine dehydratase
MAHRQHMVTLDDIRQARERIADAVDVTPCIEPYALSELCGADLRLKLETLQRTGSFKARGAVNTLRSLTAEERARGVIASSAGNHAQGVAYAASITGARALIVMPRTTPLIKVERTRALGAKVVLHGDGFDDAYDHARKLQEQRGLTFIHAFDDDRVIAGQGTVGLELVEQVPDLEAVVVPVGGGGVISGVAAAVKALRPETLVYGVQTEVAPALERSFHTGKLVGEEPSAGLKNRRSLADGIAIKRPAERTFRYIRELVDDVRLVNEEEIESGIFHLLETAKVIAEGAGAAGLAALLAGRFPELDGRRTAVVLCGANIDLNILGRIIERSLARQGRLVQLRISISDQPGGLAALLRLLAEREANVLRVHHDRVFARSSFWEVRVQVALETKNRDHVEEILAALDGAGYETG